MGSNPIAPTSSNIAILTEIFESAAIFIYIHILMTGYYTFENIDQKALEYLRAVGQLKRPWQVDRNRASLLVIDMQKYFLDPESHAFVQSAKPIVPRVKNLQDTFLELKQPVYQTRHVNTKENAKVMAIWWADLIEEGPMAAIIDGLRADRIKVIKKTQYDAFLDTDLEKDLKCNNIKQVFITGVTTHLCCETTARSAFMRGFEVFFVVDGVATFREDFHRATILNLAHGFSVPVHTDEIFEKLKK